MPAKKRSPRMKPVPKPGCENSLMFQCDGKMGDFVGGAEARMRTMPHRRNPWRAIMTAATVG
ncbi:hypothetical protein DESC_660056 [Desulfosarcina cetonica]|nr:hypothetical protein DESC_660056 [Desulfosarcina cetonica]